MLVAGYLLNQVRKPTKWVGRFFLWIMNLSHSGVTDWGLQRVAIDKHFSILDVGCGGGRTIEKLAAFAPEGMVHGVDYAAGSVAASRGRNARLIESDRVEIKKSSVSHLPFSDATFDLVTAVETQYYWPNLLGDMREVLRVLKTGGTLMVIAEAYKRENSGRVIQAVMKLLGSGCLSATEQRALFSAAGYEGIQIFEERKKGWICVMGRKAMAEVIDHD
jgi:ubiquinone/menaquinone biosynthesis C-methylase UbiE